jgi:hypothetical protein
MASETTQPFELAGEFVYGLIESFFLLLILPALAFQR